MFSGVSALLERLVKSAAAVSRSSVLGPLNWLLGICVAGLVGLVWKKAPPLMLAIAGALVGAIILVYLTLYVIAFWKYPDRLRSEMFHISKLITEKISLGDDSAGVRELAAALEDDALELEPEPEPLLLVTRPNKDDEA